MSQFPQPIQEAAAAFDKLPGVGPRAALRYAYWLLTQPKDVIASFARTLERLQNAIATCETCQAWAEQSPCNICRDGKREASLLCIVATTQDLHAIEETGAYRGYYHVLRGTLDPIEGRTPETLTLAALIKRLHVSPVTELILALDADIPGDTTALYLKKQLTGLPIKITRLARGLPTGAALEYADAYTLADALKNRRET